MDVLIRMSLLNTKNSEYVGRKIYSFHPLYLGHIWNVLKKDGDGCWIEWETIINYCYLFHFNKGASMTNYFLIYQETFCSFPYSVLKSEIM
jgi:hypothetical protein